MENWHKRRISEEVYGRRVRLRRSKRKRKIRKTFYVLKVFLFLVFAGSAIMAIQAYHDSQKEQSAFDELLFVAEQTKAETVAERDENKLKGYSVLYEQNNDFAGWLKIPNTPINYPVMYTPGEPEYYLYRAFDGTSSKSGTPFIGKDGAVDTDCLIIYGHNMKNDTMFGTLDNYIEENFWRKNKFFSFDTPYEQREYEVFATVKCDILAQNEMGVRYYNYSGNLTENEFDRLIEWLTENACYDTGVVPEYGEQIIILSTCSDYAKDARFIVAAVKNND